MDRAATPEAVPGGRPHQCDRAPGDGAVRRPRRRPDPQPPPPVTGGGQGGRCGFDPAVVRRPGGGREVRGVLLRDDVLRGRGLETPLTVPLSRETAPGYSDSRAPRSRGEERVSTAPCRRRRSTSPFR